MPDNPRTTPDRAAVYRITLTIPADDTTRDDHRPIRTRTPREIIAALCGFGDPGELEYVEEPLDSAAEPSRLAKYPANEAQGRRKGAREDADLGCDHEWRDAGHVGGGTTRSICLKCGRVLVVT